MQTTYFLIYGRKILIGNIYKKIEYIVTENISRSVHRYKYNINVS